MIVRKTVSIVSPSAQKCIGNFPPPLLLSVPRDSGLVAWKTGCVFFLNLIIINSATLSHSPPGLSLLVEYNFFSDPGPRKDHAYVVRAPHRLTRPAFEAHPGRTPFHPKGVSTHSSQRAHPLPASPFQWLRSRTATLGKGAQHLSCPYVGLTVHWAVSVRRSTTGRRPSRQRPRSRLRRRSPP